MILEIRLYISRNLIVVFELVIGGGLIFRKRNKFLGQAGID